MKNWLITGASRGLGKAMAQTALSRGDKVVLAGRRLGAVQAVADAEPSRALAVQIDVTDGESVRRGTAEAIAWSPSIDVLVNNAGHGLHGAVEEVSDEEAREVFEVNFFGQLRVLRAVLPHMRRQRRGHVINIGSISGLLSAAGTGLYSATKFALEGVSEAMQAELAPLGVFVTIVEPGPFRTDFNGTSLLRAEAPIDDYSDTAGRRTASLRTTSGKQSGDPVKAAELIYKIAGSDAPPLHLVLGDIAIERARGKLRALASEIDAWEAPSRATAY
ncbi:SDR family NAD(P)-dependent oxidoreductase [Silicimonas algicola]|uniref:Short-subunit dehydrogenase n=1 Tax=Silicimonas algicola TaxID=1826607 RepID=A0A316FYC3_9RHOB|nr:oxidoreductase [Silicimonas algicola]AZQ68331.1 SDR family NAD(P)-dependent oxidoreductase [Silicimonas algicola]PWK53599.1 short-subunit dehydrogenase [Silicimonas algicola]